VVESVFHLDDPGEGKKGLNDLTPANLLMLPYVLLLFATTALAVALTVVPLLKLTLPSQLQQLLPYRTAVIAGLGLLLIVILGFQSLRGFGLENAVIDFVDADLTKERGDAKLPDQIRKYEIKRDSELDRLGVRHTNALRFTMLSHLMTVVGAG